MKRSVFTASHHGQVLKSVVIANAVDMVDHVAFRNRAISLLPDKPLNLVLATRHYYYMIPVFGDVAASLVRLTHLLSCFRGMLEAKVSLTFPFPCLRLQLGLAVVLSCFRRGNAAKMGLAIFLPRLCRMVASCFHVSNYNMNCIWGESYA